MTELFEIKNLSPDLLELETARVMALIRGIIPAGEVHEVGSTAVPGTIGKQDIDILVRVPAAAFPAARQVLDSALARDPLQLSTSDYQGYRVESPLDVAVQLTVVDSLHDDLLKFLDVLRSDTVIVQAYNTLKREWNGRPMSEYRQAKDAFIRSVLATARSSQ